MEATPNGVPFRYRNFHLWMLIPFVISVLGFSYSYYLNLANATFHQHVHGISATLWYILIVVQPYVIVRQKNVQRHRTLGAIGLILAGVVAGSAFAIIPKNIDNVATLDANGFFNPTFAYFATLIDFVLISMFITSVSLAILSIKQKSLENHVQWLMASVLFVLSPGLARLLGLAVIIAQAGNMEGVSLVKLAIPAMAVMVSLTVFFYQKCALCGLQVTDDEPSQNELDGGLRVHRFVLEYRAVTRSREYRTGPSTLAHSSMIAGVSLLN